jgi:hypothetical protein
MLRTASFMEVVWQSGTFVVCVSEITFTHVHWKYMTFVSKVALVKSDYWTMKYTICNVIVWPLITQVWSSVHLVSLRSRPMISLHTTAQACHRKYAAALLLVAYLCQNQWKSLAGQDCIWNDDCLLWHVTVPTAVSITKFSLKILFGQVMSIYCENYIKSMHWLCGQIAETLLCWAAGTCGYHCDIMFNKLQLTNDTEVCLYWGKGAV